MPIAAALVSGGMPLGAALVFLMAGPATNVATMGTILRTFGKRVFAIYLGTLVIGSLALGKIFEFVLEPQLVTGTKHVHGGAHWLESLGGLTLLALVLWFAVSDIRKLVSSRKAATGGAVKQIEISIGGMTCGGCVKKVHQVIVAQDGVEAVDVKLDSGKATILGEFDAVQLDRALAKAGFETLNDASHETQAENV